MSSRPSTSSIRSESKPNLNRPNSLKIKYVRLDQGIPNIIYEEKLFDFQTQTKMDISFQLNVIILKPKFELDKKSLQKEFMSKANCTEIIAFSKTYSKTYSE